MPMYLAERMHYMLNGSVAEGLPYMAKKGRESSLESIVWMPPNLPEIGM